MDQTITGRPLLSLSRGIIEPSKSPRSSLVRGDEGSYQPNGQILDIVHHEHHSTNTTANRLGRSKYKPSSPSIKGLHALSLYV